MTARKRVSRRAHKAASKGAERLSLRPLSFEQALKGALATQAAQDDPGEDKEEARGTV